MNLRRSIVFFAISSKPRSRGDEPFTVMGLDASTPKTPLTRG